jgi:hypothetical protein
MAQRVHLIALRAGEADDGHPPLASRPAGGENVGRAARGRKPHEHIAWLPEREHLPGEQVLEPEVVADGGCRRRIGAKCERGQGRAIDVEAHHQFGREVLRVGRAAAITGQQYLFSRPQRLGDDLGRLRHGINKRTIRERRADRAARGFEVMLHPVGVRSCHCVSIWCFRAILMSVGDQTAKAIGGFERPRFFA